MRGNLEILQSELIKHWICITSDDDIMIKSSRLFEIMEDHPIADGELKFPIMGHTFRISCGRNKGSGQQLKFTAGSYPSSQKKPSELMGVSFVMSRV